jgi:uncharacterized repeat protein (TIGR04052 family)
MYHRVPRTSSVFLALVLAAAPTGCDAGERAVAIETVGMIGDRPFACGVGFEGIGTTGSTLTPLDFRIYVHDVRVITEAGEVAVALTDDGEWQAGGVALLDYEGGLAAGCEGGNPPTNTVLRGTVPGSTGAIRGVRFRLGVPADRNHLDAATAPSPLNLTSMFWGWLDGYKFVRIEGRSTGQPGGFRFHLGATGCTGDPFTGTRTCSAPNRPEIAIDGYDPARDVVVADLAALYESSDVDDDAGGSPGCMSEVDDPDCEPLFEALGIGDPAGQRLFRMQAR